MTRLARHDEIVERMAEAGYNRNAIALGIPSRWKINPVEISPELAEAVRQQWRANSSAALDALLTAVVELGVGKHYEALHLFGKPPEPAKIILQLEDKP